jgi:rhodanese-related sulfurtransferase
LENRICGGDYVDREILYNCLSRIGKLVESPEKLKILDAVCQAERSVESISDVTGIPFRSVSHHLQKLTDYGFLQRTKQGRRVLYSVSSPDVAVFLERMKRLAEVLYLELPFSLRSLSEFRMESVHQSGLKEYCLVDLRPREEYLHGHLPEAVNIPYTQFEGRINELPGDTPVLAYCRDKYCDLADKAVEMLRNRGREAWRLEDSVTSRLLEEQQQETKGLR